MPPQLLVLTETPPPEPDSVKTPNAACLLLHVGALARAQKLSSKYALAPQVVLVRQATQQSYTLDAGSD